MTIETKYNIGDEVWFEYRGRPQKTKIQIIDSKVWDGGQSIYYTMNYEGIIMEFRESYLFPTKEELLKSL